MLMIKVVVVTDKKKREKEEEEEDEEEEGKKRKNILIKAREQETQQHTYTRRISHLRIVKGANYMVESIYSLDVRQKRIT